MRYGRASRITGAGISSGRKSCAASRIPSAMLIHVRRCSTGADLTEPLGSPPVDLRLTEQQIALREEAAAFATALRPLLEADPEWRRQGMLSDGDSREVTRELGSAGWIGMTWPEEVGGRGLTHVDAALVEDVFGYHWLPLSLYLLSYKTIGCALERFGARAQGAAAGADRAGRAHVLPGVLGARLGQRPRVAHDARALNGDASSSMGARSGHRAPGSPTGSTSPCARIPRRRGTEASPCSSPRSIQPESRYGASRARRRLPLRGLPRRGRDPGREPRRRGRPAAGTSSCTRSTSSASRRRSSAASRGSWTVSRRVSPRRVGSRRAGAARELRGELAAARLLSLRAADLLDRGDACERRLGDGEARRCEARSAGRAGGRSISSVLRAWRTATRRAPFEGRVGGAVPRVGRLDDLGRLGRDPAAGHRPARARRCR